MMLSELLAALSSGRSKQEREYAMLTLALTLGQPYRLVMPGDKSCWKSAALTLRLMGRPQFDSAIPAMLCWLRDMSSPGADIIQRTLAETLPRRNLAQQVERAACTALAQEDAQWLCNLACFIPVAHLKQTDFDDRDVWAALCGAGAAE